MPFGCFCVLTGRHYPGINASPWSAWVGVFVVRFVVRLRALPTRYYHDERKRPLAALSEVYWMRIGSDMSLKKIEAQLVVVSTWSLGKLWMSHQLFGPNAWDESFE